MSSTVRETDLSELDPAGLSEADFLRIAGIKEESDEEPEEVEVDVFVAVQGSNDEDEFVDEAKDKEREEEDEEEDDMDDLFGSDDEEDEDDIVEDDEEEEDEPVRQLVRPKVVIPVSFWNQPQVQELWEHILATYKSESSGLKLYGDKRYNTLLACVKAVCSDVEDGTIIQQIDAWWHRYAEQQLFIFMIRRAPTEEEERHSAQEPQLIITRWLEGLKNKITTDLIAYCVHVLAHGKTFDHEETDQEIEMRQASIFQERGEYSTLFYSWRAFEIQLLPHRPSFPYSPELDLPPMSERSGGPVDMGKMVLYRLEQPYVAQVGGGVSRDVPKTLEQCQPDHSILVDVIRTYVMTRGNTKTVWRLLDEFFFQRLRYRMSKYKTLVERKAFLEFEYAWIYSMDLLLPRTRKAHHELVQESDVTVNSVKRKETEPVEEEDDEHEGGISKKIFVSKPDMLFPRPKNLFYKAEILAFIEKVNTPSELYRLKIDRTHGSPTFGKRIKVPFIMAQEETSLDSCRECIELLTCLIILTKRLTVIQLKEDTVHLNTLDESKIRDAFESQWLHHSRLYRRMIVTLMSDARLKTYMEEVLERTKIACVKAFIGDTVLSPTKAVFNGIIRRNMRKSRLSQLHPSDYTPLDYACRVKCADLVVRPASEASKTSQYVYTHDPIEADDKDVFYYPTIHLKKLLCSKQIIITDTHVTVHGKRFYLGRCKVTPPDTQRNIIEFTAKEYHAFHPIGSLSMAMPFQDVFHKQHTFMTRIYDHLEQEFDRIQLREFLPTLMYRITESCTEATVSDVMALLYAVIVLRDPICQLYHDALWTSILPRIQDLNRMEMICNSDHIIHAFCQFILNITPAIPNGEAIITYMVAFVQQRIHITFPFLDIVAPPVTALYLTHRVRMVSLLQVVQSPSMVVPDPEYTQGVRKKKANLCMFCYRSKPIPTIQFVRRKPRKVWVCESCLEAEKFKVVARK